MKLGIFFTMAFLGDEALIMKHIPTKHINVCNQFIKETIGESLPVEVDAAVVQKLKLTSSVAFTRGTLGEVGKIRDNYKQFFVCTVINDTGEVISLYETKVKLHYEKEAPLNSEYSKNYVDNDGAFFDLFLFSRHDDDFLFQEDTRYNNTQLYQYFSKLEDAWYGDVRLNDAEGAILKHLVGTWYLVNDNVSDNCYQSIGISVHNNFTIGNECDEISGGRTAFDEKELVREAGKWHLDKGILILNRDRIYRDSFLNLSSKTVAFRISLTDNANKLILIDKNNNRLVFLKYIDKKISRPPVSDPEE